MTMLMQQDLIARRSFLKQSLSAAALAMLGDSSAAKTESKSAIKFAYSLYGMKQLPLDQALAACAEIGYDAVELAVMEGWPADPKTLSSAARQELSKRMAELKLSLAALMENLPLDVDDARHRQNLERLRLAAELAHDLTPDRPPIIETVLGGKPGDWPAVRDRFAARLADWQRVAAENEIVVAIKPHRFGAMNLPEQAIWLLEQVNSPWIRLVYDYSHFQHRDLPLADTMRKLLPSSAMIHIKDTVIEAGQPRFVLPGDGGVDYVALLREAAAMNYSGTVCVEVSGMLQNQPGYDAVASARRAYQNVAPAFIKAGVARISGG